MCVAGVRGIERRYLCQKPEVRRDGNEGAQDAGLRKLVAGALVPESIRRQAEDRYLAARL